MTFDGSQIPQALRNLNQWLCWQKPRKNPIDPRTGGNTNAPAAEWSYDECITAAAEHGYGIGFSVKNGIFGIDFDHVLDAAGRLKPEYAHLSEIVDKIGSYTEISPSGEGLHIFARCDDIPQECKTCRKQNIPIEMYCEKRYITVTGKAWRNPGVLRELTGDEYREIHTLFFGGTTPAPEPTTQPARTAPPKVDFPKLRIPAPTEEPKTPDLIVVMNIRRTPKGGMLWKGITTGYKSQSEADAALMVMLADACDYNIYQMERLFLQSGLAKRDKAQNRPDYIRRTAIHAIQYVYADELKTEARIADLPKWMRKGMLRYTRNPYQVNPYQGRRV